MSNETTNTTGVRQVFFKFYDDYLESYVQFLSGEQLKELIVALIAFHREGEITDLSHDPVVAMAYNSICGNIVRDEKKYQESINRKRKQRERDEQKNSEQNKDNDKKEQQENNDPLRNMFNYNV